MPDQHPRILIHAGFHRTGTTTVQRTLRANRALIKPHVALALPWKLKPLLQAARAYSTYGDPLTLAKFTHRAEVFVDDLPGLAKRGLIMCSEDLSGHLPGRDGLPDYRAAPTLMDELVRALLRRFPKADLSVVYSTRAPRSWLTSAYWEHVKSSDQTLSEDEFCRQYAPAADFIQILNRVSLRIGPSRLTRFALEDHANARLGPAEPLLRLAGFNDDLLAEFDAVPRANTRLPQDVLDHLLALNRSHADSKACQAAKRAYLNGLGES